MMAASIETAFRIDAITQITQKFAVCSTQMPKSTMQIGVNYQNCSQISSTGWRIQRTYIIMGKIHILTHRDVPAFDLR